jgi:hypothetical protein
MADFYDFNATFFLSLATMVFGFLAGALGYALKSKCSSIKCCGCIEIIRDVELEAELEVTPVQQQLPQNETLPPVPPAVSRTR